MLHILFLKGREIATEYFLYHFQVKNAQKNCHQKKKKSSGNWVFGIFQDKLYISENPRLSRSTENHLALWAGYVYV
jgi:hypothetical protein